MTNPATIWIAAHRQAEVAKATEANARAALLASFPGIRETALLETPIGKVQVTPKDRRDFNIAELARRADESLFDLVTAPKVVVAEFDNAVKWGTIPPNMLAAVVTPNPYLDVREI